LKPAYAPFLSSNRFRERAKVAKAIKPLTPMIDDIARDLRIAVQEDGLRAAPETAQMEAEIQVPVHQPYGMDIIERIEERCEILLGKKTQKSRDKSALGSRA
jgi:segregation and condensation protein B